jgi:hypothetical protein
MTSAGDTPTVHVYRRRPPSPRRGGMATWFGIISLRLGFLFAPALAREWLLKGNMKTVAKIIELCGGLEWLRENSIRLKKVMAKNGQPWPDEDKKRGLEGVFGIVVIA